MRAARLLGRYVFVRELLPRDLKIEIERVSASDATAAARFLANVVGSAHARQMDAATRKHWSAEVERRQPKSLDGPSWLWTSVVDLIARLGLSRTLQALRAAVPDASAVTRLTEVSSG